MAQLYDHQKYTVECMNSTDNLMLTHPTGSGKSAIILEWELEALKDGRIEDMLIICPASLVDKWAQDIEDFIMFDHVTEEDIDLLRSVTTIRSYQMVYHMKSYTIHHRNKPDETVKKRELREDIDKLWGAVAIDEGHGIGGHSSAQTLACHTVARLAKYRWLATATPTGGSSRNQKGDFQKLYGEVTFLQPGRWNSWSAWCREYVRCTGKFHQILEYNDEKCLKLLEEVAITVDLNDCYDMPDYTESVISCKLVEKKAYKDLREDKYDLYDIDPQGPGVKWGKCMQLCSGCLMTDSGVRKLRTSKDDALETILAGTDEPIVIFCNYTASIDRCKELCDKYGKVTAIQDGRSHGPEWKRFASGEADVIICQYQSGGAGLNLQNSHIMVFFEPCYSTTLYTQARGRIYRIGQKNHCTYYFLSTPNSVESRVWASVRGGTSVVEKMFIDWAQKGYI